MPSTHVLLNFDGVRKRLGKYLIRGKRGIPGTSSYRRINLTLNESAMRELAHGGDPDLIKSGKIAIHLHNISLKEMLGPYKEYFSDEIFGGSKRSFNSAVKELEKIKTWGKASSVLKKKIFEKHEVDITSEAAVEFTDLLQSYFKKQK